MSGRAFLFDSNVWIALAFSAHPFHGAARAAFAAASDQQPALFCRATQQSVLRLLTTDAIIKPFRVATPTNRQAPKPLTIFDAWTALAKVRFADEPSRLMHRWRELADLQTSSPKRWMDAYLAAFALEADIALITTDGASTPSAA